jgi:hypothetical protein
MGLVNGSTIIMDEQRRYVRCKVMQGLFDSEFYVAVEASSAYVDRTTVKVASDPAPGKEVAGEVMAYVVREDKHLGRALVELSGQPVVGGLRTWVPITLLAGA